VVGSVVRVKRRVAAATGCSALLPSHFRAGTDARVAARGQVAAAGTSPPGVALGERRRLLLPGEALVELEGGGGLDQRIGGWIVRSAGDLPERRAAGGCDPGRCRRLAEVDEDVAYRGRVGDEGDDAHRAATVGTHEWENCVDAGEQQRPGVAGSATMGRFGGGFRVGGGRRGRRGQREGGDG
jgi:hypothetical protein